MVHVGRRNSLIMHMKLNVYSAGFQILKHSSNDEPGTTEVLFTGHSAEDGNAQVREHENTLEAQVGSRQCIGIVDWSGPNTS
jgi:hypothetical protein